MDFTPLHRALGSVPGPLTDAMLDEAVAARVRESDALDFKKSLPEEKALAQSDLVKDIAAFANSGGGVLVFGVEEEQGHAKGRLDVGEVSESYERTLRRVAVSGIHPPVFNLEVQRVGEAPTRALVVAVPSSQDGPHLIYKGEYFGAPIRNHSDSEWMKERQIERMYRARFDEQRHSVEALDALYTEAVAGKPIEERAWLVAVARPRIPVVGRERMNALFARDTFSKGARCGTGWTRDRRMNPIESADIKNPRPGLRRWVALDSRTTSDWRSCWLGLHFDGSVSLATAVGGGRTGIDTYSGGNRVDADRCERAVANFMGLVRIAGEDLGVGEYDVRVGIEYAGTDPMFLEIVSWSGEVYDGGSVPIAQFAPVEMTIRNDIDEAAFIGQVRELALDVINQGGLTSLTAILGQPG